MTLAPARRDLGVLFAPASVAVVGASDDQAKWGHWMARGAIRGSGRRRVFLVNRRADTVLGLPAHRSLADLPEPPEPSSSRCRRWRSTRPSTRRSRPAPVPW